MDYGTITQIRNTLRKEGAIAVPQSREREAVCLPSLQ
jgi:hypothetical protein